MAQWRAFLEKELRLRRWVLLGITGVLCMGGALIFLVLLRGSENVLMVYLLTAAAFLIGACVTGYSLYRFFHAVLKRMGNVPPHRWQGGSISQLLYRQQQLEHGPKVVAIGGGTGMPTLLRGLKAYTSNITAVVTVADDGGGSGRLRNDLGVLPPGDIRNCIMALADAEPVMEKLLQHRFREGELTGQSFGNLMLVALTDISGSFLEAIQQLSDVLAVKGRVLPVTLDNAVLCARLRNGLEVEGESDITETAAVQHTIVDKIWLKHPVTPLPAALEAIAQADVICIGPGSLYTSVMPNLLSPSVVNAIAASRAAKVYIANIMTQPGETTGLDAADHLQAIRAHTGATLVDAVIANNNVDISEAMLERYQEEGGAPVLLESRKMEHMGVRVIGCDLVHESKSLVRHSSGRLADAVMAYYVQVREKRVNIGEETR